MTNGESAAGVMRAAGIEGDILCWNDVLHEGPVPDVPLDALRELRARFIAGSWPGPGPAERVEGETYERVLQELKERDLRLASGKAGDVVLWFEHDLYDQLQLLQVLDMLSHHDCGLESVALICNDEYLGLSTPDRLRERLAQRTPVTPEMMALGRTAWDAFRSPDPSSIVALLGQNLSALPYLHAALARHLQQFPSTFNGLSRSEQAGLDAVASGKTRVRDAFAVSQQQEEAFFLGDVVFLDYMKDLASGETPLVTVSGDGMDAAVALTGAGRAVLGGEADRVRLNGIDRWYGGVHLEGRDAIWRWNGTTLVSGDRT